MTDSSKHTVQGGAFVRRHVGPDADRVGEMLAELGLASLDALMDQTIPADVRSRTALALPEAHSEPEALEELQGLAGRNRPLRSFIGMGYHDCHTPPVIRRNVLENPGWYTAYTPYQAEIAQGRLEMLLNFQTLVADLTGLPLANASLLDEATAAAEAMRMTYSRDRSGRRGFYVAADCHPATLAVLRTRAEPLGITLRVGPPPAAPLEDRELFALLLQYPATDGRIVDPAPLVARAREEGVQVIVATDLLALTLLRPPGEFGADVALGSAQRFGVPLGYGGPHAAFLSAREEYRRLLPGRIIGVSRDVDGRVAYRMALQTREQHIRREKATSNICTAQVLLAVLSACYAVYHGPDGLRRIARRVRRLTAALAEGLRRLDLDPGPDAFFDTLRVTTGTARAARVLAAARERGINLRDYGDGSVGVALDETATVADVQTVLDAFADGGRGPGVAQWAALEPAGYTPPLARTSSFLEHPVFASYHSEHELLRYLRRLESRDLSLTTSMIPLGSCTMKLNAAAEMLPVTWDGFARLHPFAPVEQTEGYAQLFRQIEGWLGEITGFAAVSLQPNAGSQGEFAGLLAVRRYHRSRSQGERDICLIPVSAHGTNPASAVLAGYRVVPVACDARGNIDHADLRARVRENGERLGALMITYPSTHGVFEEGVRELCALVHEHGGQVYMDGANLNAQVGLTRPADIGADVCHVNLHKTFCVPHGGGGPGVGPIGVAAHLAPFLPGHPLEGDGTAGPVSGAPYGSAGILAISWMYMRLMGPDGLRHASQVAILNANYMARRLEGHYAILYRGRQGRVGHEFVLDCRPFTHSAGVEVDDIAKRLMDYGFHAPTMSFPVPGTLMIEPTESESKEELDRYCDALIAIRSEIRAIEEGRADRRENVLKGAPHTAEQVTADVWERPYSRREAAYPAAWTRQHKFWPAVGRIDNAYGDRHLACACPPVESYGDGSG